MIWSLMLCIPVLVQRIRDQGIVSSKWDMCILQKDTEIFPEEWKIRKSQRWWMITWKWGFRLSMEITHVNSHWLRQHAQDVCKVSPDKVAWEEGYSYLRSCWQLIVAKRKPVFFKGADPGGLTIHNWKPHIKEYVGSTNCSLWVKRKKKKKEHKVG